MYRLFIVMLNIVVISVTITLSPKEAQAFSLEHAIVKVISHEYDRYCDLIKQVKRKLGIKKKYSEDTKLLGDLMYAEVGVLMQLKHLKPEEVELAHKLVGSVVIHRTNAKDLGANSIKETIYAKGQYHRATLARLGKLNTPECVYDWAEELLRDGPLGPKTLKFQAQFKQGGKVYKKIHNQYFCLEKEVDEKK